MPIIPKFRAITTREETWPEVYDADMFKLSKWMDCFKEGTHVFVTIRKIEHKQMRSIVQNNYYWGVVLKILAEEIGYDRDEMHDALKYKFLRYENVQGLPTVLSTTQLKTHEMEEYLQRIRRWAAVDMGIVIPKPREVD